MLRPRLRSVPVARQRLATKALVACFALVASMVATVGTAQASYQPGEPPGMDPGIPPFTGSADPVPAPPGTYDAGSTGFPSPDAMPVPV